MTLNHFRMTSSTVRALSDGSYFLAYGRELLAAVALEPYCLHCRGVGLPATVTLTPDGIVSNWRCEHTAGWASRKKAIELPELLHALGWNIRCSACKENVSGDNAPTDSTFSVTCSCSTRLMANPLPRPHGIHQVDRLGRS